MSGISITQIEADVLREHLLRGDSYFQVDLPEYINFDNILQQVANLLGNRPYGYRPLARAKKEKKVNHTLHANIEGVLNWQPMDLMHPVVYVSLTNAICEEGNWKIITERFKELRKDSIKYIKSFSTPAFSAGDISQQASDIQPQVQIEGTLPSILPNVIQGDNPQSRFLKRSLSLSLEYDHLLQANIVNRFGSLYTHTIPWSLYGVEEAKARRGEKQLIGNRIDDHIQSCRYGQTNGLPYGSALTEIIIEMVLAFVDYEIYRETTNCNDVEGVLREYEFYIIRHQGDYRIYSNSEEEARKILRVVSDKLHSVNMVLSDAATTEPGNVIESAMTEDVWAAVNSPFLLDVIKDPLTLLRDNASKFLLSIHSFGQKHSGSKELELMMWRYVEVMLHRGKGISFVDLGVGDVRMLVAAALDMAVVDPSIVPSAVFIISYLISAADPDEGKRLWELVRKKVKRMPDSGYIEIWLQRIAIVRKINLAKFDSKELMCQIVAKKGAGLWNNDWILSKNLKGIMNRCEIVDFDILKELGDALERKDSEDIASDIFENDELDTLEDCST